MTDADRAAWHARVLAVAVAHSSPVAAAWSGVHLSTIHGWRQNAGIARRRGRPSNEDVQRERPRWDCDCGMCEDWKASRRPDPLPDDDVAQTNRRFAATAPDLTLSALAPWRDLAACKDHPTDLFFPVTMSGHHPGWAAARAVCETCPVRAECAEFAEVNFLDHGMFGGLTPHERLKARRGWPTPSRRAAPCGTTGGYARHVRVGEPTCQPCRDALNRYNRDAQARRRAKVAAEAYQ